MELYMDLLFSAVTAFSILYTSKLKLNLSLLIYHVKFPLSFKLYIVWMNDFTMRKIRVGSSSWTEMLVIIF